MSALLRLFLVFRRRRFHIVHSTTPKAGLLCALAGWAAGVPIRLHTFTGQTWVGLSGPLRRLALGADRIIGALNTRCYADSESQCRFLVAEGIVPAARIGVIGQGSLAGVDLARFDPERWGPSDKEALRQAIGLPEKSRVIVYVGRITRDKGIGELLEAFATLVADGYDADLLLVGPVDDEHGGAEAFSLSRLAAQPRVYPLGYTDCPEQYLALADFLCLPSYREGFGTVVIEAAALGVPTVGSRIYGLMDAVVDGVTGMLVPPRDAVALADAMRRLLDAPERLAEMGRAARQRCRAEFDAEVVNRRLADEYERLLGMRGV
jgi:glycosyltransferase involved in cell wall biosynthesis